MANNSDAIDLMNEIESFKKKLTAAEGKANAAARAQAGAERERDQAALKAQAYRDETDQMIINAAQQLQQAWSIGIGIWSLASWAGKIAARKNYAARLLHREQTYVKVLTDLVNALKRNDKLSDLDVPKRDAEKLIAIYNANTDKLKMEMIEALILRSGTISKERMSKIFEIVDAPDLETAP